MDESVLRGMAKWPNVPAVYGWLALDRRGKWRLKGEPIANQTVVEFINRNYEHDTDGRWFFQNGPQRVYVSLDSTPRVYRVTSGGTTPLRLESQLGEEVTAITGAWIDETGALVIETENGVGTIHDRDLDAVLAAFCDANGNPLPEDALESTVTLLQQGRGAPAWLKYSDQSVHVEPIRSDEMPSRFGYDPAPQAQPA